MVRRPVTLDVSQQRHTLRFSRRTFLAGLATAPISTGCGGDGSRDYGQSMDKSQFVSDKIVFPGNPWPDGHAIIEFEWSAEITYDRSLRGHLHLRSEDYYAHDQDPFNYDDLPEDDDRSDWESKVVWNNYHACILSSTYWGHPGFALATADQPFSIEAIAGRTFEVDPLPFDIENGDPAFGIYCQGHDSVAGHRISFTREGRAFAIDWFARIAQTYVGHTSFGYSLYARKTQVQFAGITAPLEMPAEDARTCFRALVTNPDTYTETETEHQRVFYIREAG